MQKRIDSFFKPPPARNPVLSPLEALNPIPEALITYKRRQQEAEICEESHADKEHEELLIHPEKKSRKNRVYAQSYLEFGQPDFLLHTCSTCGMKYTRGDDYDEKLHRPFHVTYLRGIPFKGWTNERVIFVDKHTGDRILLVSDGYPFPRKHKVRELADLLERDLGLTDGWLLHNLCKVYMLISHNRIAGCVIAEPIKTAHRIICETSTELTKSNQRIIQCGTLKLFRVPDRNNPALAPEEAVSSEEELTKSTRLTKSNPKLLQFGTLKFSRKLARKNSSISVPEGAIFCEEESVRATCGIRAIWVAPSKRRQGIASKLLNCVRENFEPGSTVDPSRCAFSQPTSAGKAFASSYFRDGSFLVYNPEENL